jgi:hypothetical protein
VSKSFSNSEALREAVLRGNTAQAAALCASCASDSSPASEHELTDQTNCVFEVTVDPLRYTGRALSLILNCEPPPLRGTRDLRSQQGVSVPAFMIEPFSSLAVDGSQPTPETIHQPPSKNEYRCADEQSSVAAADPFFVDPEVIERARRGHAATQNSLADYLWGLGLKPLSYARAIAPCVRVGGARRPRNEGGGPSCAWLLASAILPAVGLRFAVADQSQRGFRTRRWAARSVWDG